MKTYTLLPAVLALAVVFAVTPGAAWCYDLIGAIENFFETPRLRRACPYYNRIPVMVVVSCLAESTSAFVVVNTLPRKDPCS